MRALFLEYAASLGVDLSFQGFEAEVRGLPGDYAPPCGVLLLHAEGCVGVHPWEPGVCEMKRLYVRPAGRGNGVGEALARAAIDWARRAGYSSMRLDTLPSMAAAQRMYERLGFVDRPAYRVNPIEGSRYLELRL